MDGPPDLVKALAKLKAQRVPSEVTIPGVHGGTLWFYICIIYGYRIYMDYINEHIYIYIYRMYIHGDPQICTYPLVKVYITMAS